MKQRTIKGQLVASTNKTLDSLSRRFNIQVSYTPIGFNTKSIICKDSSRIIIGKN
jgi:hypothetical protein